MIFEWSDPMTLLTPYATIALNDPDGADGYFIVIKDESTIGPTTRVTETNVPQQDGAINHRRWLTGVAATLAIEPWVDIEDEACGEERSTMCDLLVAAARSLIRAGDNEGRLLWTPQGQAERMLDDIRLLAYPVVTFDGKSAKVTFGVETGFPYAISSAETRTAVTGTMNINHGGNTELWPTIRVSGASSFTITNNSVLDDNGDPLSFLYDGTPPEAPTIGGGYAEIDMFRGVAYLNGDGANLMPWVDVENSDFFPLLPGDNSITVSSGSALFLLNSAFA